MYVYIIRMYECMYVCIGGAREGGGAREEGGGKAKCAHGKPGKITKGDATILSLHAVHEQYERRETRARVQRMRHVYAAAYAETAAAYAA